MDVENEAAGCLEAEIANKVQKSQILSNLSHIQYQS